MSPGAPGGPEKSRATTDRLGFSYQQKPRVGGGMDDCQCLTTDCVLVYANVWV